MAILNEFGYKYPVRTEGRWLSAEEAETTPVEPGAIAEVVMESDRDITVQGAAHIIKDILLTKEQYPLFVIHYIKVETRKVTAQFSYAPPQYGISGSPTISGSGSGGSQIAILLPWYAVMVLVMIAALITYEGVMRITDRYFWNPPPPTGTLQIKATDFITKKGLVGVKVYVGGVYIGRTAVGGVISVELDIGIYIVSGETIAGYHPPLTVKTPVVKNEVTTCEIWYHPEGTTPPTEGTITVYTTPVAGEVWIDNVPYGKATVGPITFPAGTDVAVSFGEVEGYITPAPQELTIPQGSNVNAKGTYTKPTGWEQYLKYALIGGGVIIAAAVIIPEVIRAAIRPKER